jgi:membrane protein DedA with SNARE-associated domain
VQILLIKYGIVAVLMASFFEADVVSILAGVAAHRGLFNPAFGIVAASFGALVGDCFWFYLGRQKVFQHSKVFHRIRSKAEILFQRVGMWQLPASHVIYGSRVATMTLLGARGSSFPRFILLDGVTCIVVATVLFSLGFALSASASRVLIDVRRVEFVLLASIGLVALSFPLLRRLTRGTLWRTSTGEDHT